MTPAELKVAADQARREGRLEAAEELLRQAIAILRTQGDSLALAHTIRHLGDLHRHTGNVAQATSCCAEALDLYRRFEGTAAQLDVANAIRSMALVSEMSGDTDRARTLWQEAKTLYSSCRVDSGIAESTSRLASLSS